MATKIFIGGSSASCVYDDRFRPLMEALGIVKIDRASNVEFNQKSQLWEATFLATGEKIASGVNRNEVIADEIRWIEANMPQAASLQKEN